MATRISDINSLSERRVWALLKYEDGSEFCFETTLNPDILNGLGIVLEEGKLVRLDKKYYIGGAFVYRQFPYSEASITLWDELHYTDKFSLKLHQFM